MNNFYFLDTKLSRFGAILIRLTLLMLAFIVMQRADAQVVSIEQSDVDILNYAIKKKFNGIIPLISEMYKYDLTEIKKQIKKGLFVKNIFHENDKDISDTIKLTYQDKISLYSKLKRLRRFKWTLNDAQKLNLGIKQIIGRDSLEKLYWKEAWNYKIVPPLYFHNNMYCLLDVSLYCGGLCGYGQITIYKKMPEGWRNWSNLVYWNE